MLFLKWSVSNENIYVLSNPVLNLTNPPCVWHPLKFKSQTNKKWVKKRQKKTWKKKDVSPASDLKDELKFGIWTSFVQFEPVSFNQKFKINLYLLSRDKLFQSSLIFLNFIFIFNEGIFWEFKDWVFTFLF